jgi:DNA polymerase III gamma/tau subunit
MRSFRIEISTDSLIMMDESQEKQDRMEFLGAVSSFLEKAVQASQVAPQIVPLSLDMLKFGVGAFKIGKSMEGQIDQTAQQFKEQLEQQQQQPEQPPPPDPEEMKMQLQMQMDQAKMQAQAQTEQMKMQAQSQTEQMKLQAEAQFKQADQQHQTQLEMAKMEHQTQLKLAEAQSHQAIEQAKLEADADLKMRIAQLDAQTKIAVARIGAAGELPPDMNENGEPIPDPAELRHAAMQSALMAALQNFSAALDEMRRPKTIVRGPDGRVLGIQ